MTADLATLTGLLERVRAAPAEGDLRLDFALCHALGIAPWAGTPADRIGWCMPGSKMARATPHLTGSIDAAVGAVAHALPGWDLDIEINALGRLGKGYATLRGPELTDQDMRQFAQTDGMPKPAPLAVCTALLQALIAQAQTEEGRHGGSALPLSPARTEDGDA